LRQLIHKPIPDSFRSKVPSAIMYSATELYPTPEIGNAVHEYCIAHSSPLPEHINSHRRDTIEWAEREGSDPNMMINTLQAQFMIFLGKLLGAKKILEVGMYTGYSALAWAEAVKGAEGAEVVCLDLPGKSTEFAKETLKRAGVLGNPVSIIEGDGAASLQTLPVTQYDVIFLDANKDGYIKFFKTILDRGLLAPNGVILADNALKSALVVDSSEKNPASKEWEYEKPRVLAVDAFNKFVLEDERVEHFLLPAFDGLNMARYKK